MRYLLFPVRFVAVLMVAVGGIAFLLGYLLIQLLTERKTMKYAPPMMALVLLMGCGTVLPYTPVVVVPLSGLYGATTCDQNGNAIIMLDPDSLKTTRMHEGQHLADIHAYPGGCRAYLARYRTEPLFRVEMELRAYCVEARAGADVSEALLRLATTKGLPDNFHISSPCQTATSVALLTDPGG